MYSSHQLDVIVMLSRWCPRVVRVIDLITFVPYPVPWAMDMNTDPSS